MAVDIAMQWNSTYSESVYTFANTINTHEGGTHEEGFRAALTTVVNKYARDKGLLKEKDDNLTGDDVREGLAAIVSVKLANPQFEGQTKTKLGNTEVKGVRAEGVQRLAGRLVRAHARPGAHDHHQGDAGRAARRMAAREGARPHAPQGPAGVGSLPGKLADCSGTDPASARSSSSRATPPAAR